MHIAANFPDLSKQLVQTPAYMQVARCAAFCTVVILAVELFTVDLGPMALAKTNKTMPSVKVAGSTL